MDDRQLTIAIHTYEKAIVVKSLLESEGIKVALQNVHLDRPIVSTGIRVRISERDLPRALRVIENAEIFTTPEGRGAKSAAPVLVPTDFSSYSQQAGYVAFHLAELLHAPIVFLYSYIAPQRTGNEQLSDALNFDQIDIEANELIEDEAKKMMEQFVAPFKEAIKEGRIPAVKFMTEIVEGIPEESIIEFAKINNPPLIVMGTRGAGKKERELVGSVTAEVLDSCRIPVYTIPESTTLDAMRATSEVVMFSNLEQSDILALDTFYRIFPDKQLNITIACLPGRRENRGKAKDSKKSMLDYCSNHYPNYKFTVRQLDLSTALDDFAALTNEQPVHLIVVPNKRKNIFARLFNPGLAHKLLFHSDIPMMAIPV